MRTLTIGLTLTTLLAAAAPALAQTPVIIDRESVLGSLRAISSQLALLQARQRDPRTASRFAALRSTLRNLRGQIAVAQPMATIGMAVPQPTVILPTFTLPHPVGAIAELPPQPVPPLPAGPHAMDEASFTGLLKALTAETFENTRLSILRSAAASQHFVIAQVVRLIEIFTFESNKLAVVVMLRGQILDKQDAYKLSGAFTFDSSKNKVLELLR